MATGAVVAIGDAVVGGTNEGGGVTGTRVGGVDASGDEPDPIVGTGCVGAGVEWTTGFGVDGGGGGTTAVVKFAQRYSRSVRPLWCTRAARSRPT